MECSTLEGYIMDSEDIVGWDKESQRAWDNDPHESEFPDEVAKILREILPLHAQILDCGCGIGKNIRGFTKLGYVTMGIEQSPVGAKYARLNSGCEVLNMRLQEIGDIADFVERFDLIFTSAVLQHSIHERKIGILRNFHLILKNNGYYLCTENTLTEKNVHTHFRREGNQFIPIIELTEDTTDGYSFTEKGWIKFMAQNRFHHIITIQPWPFYLFKKSR